MAVGGVLDGVEKSVSLNWSAPAAFWFQIVIWDGDLRWPSFLFACLEILEAWVPAVLLFCLSCRRSRGLVCWWWGFLLGTLPLLGWCDKCPWLCWFIWWLWLLLWWWIPPLICEVLSLLMLLGWNVTRFSGCLHIWYAVYWPLWRQWGQVKVGASLCLRRFKSSPSPIAIGEKSSQKPQQQFLQITRNKIMIVCAHKLFSTLVASSDKVFVY
jgi:hypothetical protein